LSQALRQRGGVLLNEQGERTKLPAPPRDRSWVGALSAPEVAGIEPIYRIEAWVRSGVDDKQRVELAIWPPFAEEPGTDCAPMRCGLWRGGKVICSYGVSAEQAVYLAYKYLQIEVEHRKIIGDDGRLIDLPIPPEPPLPPP